LGVISDARLSGRTDKAVLAERLLSISGEDTLTVDRKYASAWTGRLPTRLMILTNELPEISDASAALVSRFLIIELERSFYGEEDEGLTQKLLEELPGILLWSLCGLERLRQRRRFEQPQKAIEAMEEMEALASPVRAFIREACVIEPGVEIVTSDLYRQWVSWCEIHGRSHPGTTERFGRDLHTAFPSTKTVARKKGEKRWRAYTGIRYAGGQISDEEAEQYQRSMEY
jgi:putative DNA primase/helicase